MTEVSRVDAEPLLRALTAVRNAAREARERSSVDLESFLAVGAKAHYALQWFVADQAGELDAAKRWLDMLFSPSPPSTQQSGQARPAPPAPAPRR